MPGIVIKTNLDKITRHMTKLQEKAPQMMDEVVWDLTDAAAQIADANVPVGTPAISNRKDKKGTGAGTLKQSLFIQKGHLWGRFGYSASYAAYVEYGTPAHEIAPGVKGFLAWPIGATQLGKKGPKSGTRSRKSVAIRWVYTRKPVQHPGTQPVGWCRKAVEDAKGRIQEIASNVFLRWTQRLQIGVGKDEPVK